MNDRFSPPDTSAFAWRRGYRLVGRQVGLDSPIVRLLLAFVLLNLVLSPLFFEFYRIRIFKAINFDDYAPYMFYFLNEPGGFVPLSPHGYRPLFVLLAVPFYEMMPVLRFSLLPSDITLSYIKASQALILLSYLGMTTSILLSYVIARRLHLTRVAAATAAVAVLILIVPDGGSRDAVTYAFLLAAIALLDRPIAFGALVFATVFVNEKIALVLALMLGLRFLVYPELRRAYVPHLVCIMLALALLFLTMAIVQLPGGAHPRPQPWMYAQSFVESLRRIASAKGLYFIVWPVVLVTLVALVAWRGGGYDTKTIRLFRPSDITVIYLMALIGMLLSVELSVGRIASHTFPFLVIPFAHAAASRFFSEQDRIREGPGDLHEPIED